MGNDQSKREERDERPANGVSQLERSLPELTTRSGKDLVSRAISVDPRWYDTPDTPTSDVSFTDEDFETEPRESPRLRSYDPHTKPLQAADAVSSTQTLQQLLQRYIQGPALLQLVVGYLEYPCIEKVTFLAKCLGFDTCVFDVPNVCLMRSEGTTPEMRSANGHQSLATHSAQLQGMQLRELDAAMEKSLAVHLSQIVKSKKGDDGNSAVLVEYDVTSFLMPMEAVKQIFESVAKECEVYVQLSHHQRISLTTSETEAEGKSEKTIQKGELVWRRLQHWSTNVRKEKKFNIWAKGLPEAVKERILKIALEIGFETAVIQQNGNIHLEIKPPEGQHRRKLKHATDELRLELEPIDEAVCQNVEQHLKEWLSEFHRTGKQKDILNCRFVLPAEWLRQTSEKLAAQYGLCVSMETGIELLFYRADVDPTTLQDSVAPKDLLSKKSSKSKNRSKKRSPEQNLRSDPLSTSNGGGGGHSTEPTVLPFDNRMHEAVHRTSPSGSLVMGAVRRSASRNKYDYAWDPSWPTAQSDRGATSQHTF